MQKHFHKRGQAAAELAILGTLILVAFAYIMNFGQSLSAMQQVKMETFRRALQKAYIRNSSVDFALKKNIRNASINSGFGQGQGLSPQASSKVMWQKGMSGDFKTEDQGGWSFWQINDLPLAEQYPGYGLPVNKKKIITMDGSKKEVYVPSSVYKTDETRVEEYDFNNTKTESNSGIGYAKTASVDDTATGIAYARYDTKVDDDPWDDETPQAEYSSPTTHDYATSKVYTYNKTWSTPTER